MVERDDRPARSSHADAIAPSAQPSAAEVPPSMPSRTPVAPGDGPDQARPAGRWARWPIYALVPVLVALAVDLHGLRDQRRVNAMLARGELAAVAERDTERGLLAHAYRLHVGGQLEDALEAYRAAAPDAEREPGLRSVHLFNLANLYLERAVELEAGDEIQPAMSLVELAKQNYREILADDPGHWDARHNLSRALEMLPDIAAVDYENEWNPERSPQSPQASRSYEGLP